MLGPTQSHENAANQLPFTQYIRSQPTPQDVQPDRIPALTVFNGFFSDIYITGFITPFTGETAEQVKERLQSVPDKDRFPAVMVESYRLASDPLLLDIMHILLAQYYVEYFTTTDLGGASAYLKRAEIEALADGFASAQYAIPLPLATSTVSSDLSKERLALVALYNMTDGPNWATTTNWLSEEPFGEWHGVKTNRRSVIELDLKTNQLNGQIPSDLEDLSNLKLLSFAGNRLSGEIPAELGN